MNAMISFSCAASAGRPAPMCSRYFRLQLESAFNQAGSPGDGLSGVAGIIAETYSLRPSKLRSAGPAGPLIAFVSSAASPPGKDFSSSERSVFMKSGYLLYASRTFVTRVVTALRAFCHAGADEFHFAPSDCAPGKRWRRSSMRGSHLSVVMSFTTDHIDVDSVLTSASST